MKTGVEMLPALVAKIIKARDALEARNSAGGLGADTHAALREAIMTMDAAAQHLSIHTHPAATGSVRVDEARELLAVEFDRKGWTYAARDTRAGKLEAAEVAIAAMLAFAAAPTPDA